MPITTFAAAAETAEAVRHKMISGVELVTETLQRINFHNPALNAIVWQDREGAMARARQARRWSAGGLLGSTLRHT